MKINVVAVGCKGKTLLRKKRRASAVEYYDLAKNTAKVIDCYYHLEDWNKLEGMIDSLPENDPLLETIGDMFAANAVHNEAVKAYVKLGKIKNAINLCILYNRWDMAIDLAKKHNISKISDLLTKYTAHLINQGQIMTAIQVNIQAEHYMLAAEHLFEIADNEAHKKNKNLLNVKKMYVYGAKLVELHRKSSSAAGDAHESTSFLYENAWKGAEAYHYYMMAQRLIYGGKFHEALCVAYKLQDYEEYIPESDIYSLLALASCLDRAFGVCSKAFMKLKTIENLPLDDLEHYKKLAWEIFSQNEPVNLNKKLIKCDNCENSIEDINTVCPHCKVHFPTCISSGRSIVGESIWFCQSCRHPAIEKKMVVQNTCPLCHSKHDK